MLNERFKSNIIPYVSEAKQQEEAVFNYDNKQAMTTKKHADRNKLFADALFNLAEESTDSSAKDDYYTGAGSNYIKAIEKFGKGVLHAIGDGDMDATSTKNGKPLKLKSSHSITEINEHLKSKGENLLSADEAKFVEQAHGKKGLSYIATEYGDVNGEVVSLSPDTVNKLKEITSTASIEYERRINVEKISRLIKDALGNN